MTVTANPGAEVETDMSESARPLTAFQRFTEFARRVVNVSKSEVDAQEKSGDDVELRSDEESEGVSVTPRVPSELRQETGSRR